MRLSKKYVEGKTQIIAHRGGVITPDAPECSLAAIRKAVDEGYDAVELDVRASADHLPIVFHDSNLQRMCGREERVEDLNAEAVTKISYLETGEHVASLDEALALCASSGIGVMMEIKASGEVRAFYQNIKDLLDKYQLRDSTIVFPPKEEVTRFFEGYAPIQQHIGKIRDMHEKDMPVNELCFIFELPWDVSREDIAELREMGVFSVIAINTFRYVGKYRSRNSGRYIKYVEEDINRMMEWGVDALQIDSDYYGFIVQ
jgi:glycerophosphoryl diester phosphodiesterase